MAKVLMIQGTMSGVGKSLLTAGLLRVFAQDGLRCAPFKSQNMALNSFVTDDGLEMGRAQAMQAEAAGIRPCVDMNPILLKPTTDVGSQVIVNGKSIGNRSARAYFAMKKQLIPDILAAYERLAARCDVIVVEGAGSPAEINLRENDIVNMGLAELLDAPVLLVGDIDRGGVFAQLLGTCELLEENERKRIRGLVINRFRGDVSLLTPGLALLEERCKAPVLGVLPYLPLDLEDEDSLSERLRGTRPTCGEPGVIGGGRSVVCGEPDAICGKPGVSGRASGAPILAVIRLPRISNFTDFQPLSACGAQVRYAERVRELEGADCIILPGSKNTLADLRFLRERGLDRAVRQAAARGVPVVGICGGYQMLGEFVEDEAGAEGTPGRESGLGLLPCRTRLREEKTLRRSRGTIRGMTGIWTPLNGLSVEGYEIHLGVTGRGDASSAEVCPAGDAASSAAACPAGDAASSAAACPAGDVASSMEVCQSAGTVIGTYFHGIFENDRFRERFLDCICAARSAGGGTPQEGAASGQSTEEWPIASRPSASKLPASKSSASMPQASRPSASMPPAGVWPPSEAMPQVSMPVPRLSYQAYKQEQYDRLAQAIRTHLDMDAIRRLLDE